MKQGDLYCWARQMDFDLPEGQVAVPLDHTWVTDYPNPGPPNGFTLPLPADKHYWYCWGVFHSASDSNQNPAPYKQFLGPFTADIEEAICICEPNLQTDPTDPSWSHAHLGKIYGQHGVCHQAANRILWASGVQPNGERLTVKGVQGWELSWLVYGPYGYKLTPGKWPLPHCNGKGPKPPDDENEDAIEADLNQIIPAGLQSTLSGIRREKLKEVQKRMLEKKASLDDQIAQLSLSAVQYADRINHLVATALQEARREVLNDVEFKALFGVDYHPALFPLLVDPRMAKVYAPPADAAMGAGASS